MVPRRRREHPEPPRHRRQRRPRRLHELLHNTLRQRNPPQPLRPGQHPHPRPHRMTETPRKGPPLRKTHPTLALVCDEMTLATKSPSYTIAASGLSPNTWVTDAGKSVLTAPGTSNVLSCQRDEMVLRAALTVGSGHAIWCLVSWSYFSGPAWRR